MKTGMDRRIETVNSRDWADNDNERQAKPRGSARGRFPLATPLIDREFSRPILLKSMAPSDDPLLPVRWFVAHTRPRCEKRLADFCLEAGLIHFLPLYQSVKCYPGKRIIFQKPLFPGYVFLELTENDPPRIRQNRYVARLLEPVDQREFIEQLGDIRLALESEREVRLAPTITEGRRVQIKSGPLRGLEGVVLRRQGITEVVLRLDFIAQAAAVQVLADELELL